ncbi:pre-rRNA processing protein Tsr1 [Blumeria hordei DH14]|uniref:Pre-rRNA processing protein Tsr1 n=1 Tax=Blumeria graminis f. sp. hordei (strain DH14) TaxID=546991 RepID=N1J5X4_BLUG1|nr:pre-rRNA processing protein Tsr1 [Blumeria hordei DH14]
MPSKLESHSHRSTTKVVHKPFKSRKATKGFLKEIKKGKMNDLSHRKTPHQLAMSKLDRRNHNKQKQLAKHREHLKEAGIFSGRNGAPRIVAIIPLSSNVSAAAAARSLSQSLDITCEVPEEGQLQIEIDRFKQKVQFVLVPAELMACLDAGRVADFVIFILSAEQEVNEEGENIIRSVESQGISTLLTTVQGLDNIEPPKKRVGVLSSLKSFIKHFHPEQEKVHNLDSRQECANLMRSICTTSPKGVRWRDERSWMLVDEVKWPATPQESVAFTGTIRGKGLKADRLIQVGEWGDYQIEKIVAAPLNSSEKRSSDSTDASKAEIILEIPGDDQDDLAELALEETIMQDVSEKSGSFETTEKRGVLLDDHHYFSDEEKHKLTVPKRLPQGTSAYQAAWYLGDEISDSDSDIDETDELDTEMEITPLPQDGTEGLARPEPTEIDPTTYAQSEIFLDPNLDDEHEAEQLAAFRRRKHDEAEDDREFPDEIELHPQVLARERLARYRGLKSLRSSPWEESEDRAHEPEEWRRLLQVPNYKSARSRATREALVGGVAPGTRVHIYLRNVPLSLKTHYDSSRPLNLFSLLRHEHKRAVLNFNINLSSDYPEPIKSKTELILQCGPRRFVINPLFSQGGHTSNDVHKFDRYLHPGTSAVATFIAPLTWGSVPTLVFKRTRQPQEIPDKSKNSIIPLTLIATGTSLPPSSTRVIAKRVILTGHPYKIHKKLVTIRYMFFNREDVEWFKALQLWTKRGRSGYIKESLGTHGYFKATFDAKINPQDSVGVSLYKRVWPRLARTWNDLQEEIIANEADDIIMGS